MIDTQNKMYILCLSVGMKERAMKRTRISFALAIVFAVISTSTFLTGCANTHNVLDIDKEDALYQRTSTASVGKIDMEGNQIAVYNGLSPMNIKQDADGNWVNIPGPASMISVPMPGDKVAYILSPKDVFIKGFKYTPVPADGQPAFSIEEVSTNISTPLAQHTAALASALEQLKGMTQVEAEAMVKKWEEAGKMAPSVVEIIKLAMAALFPPAAVIP